MLYTEPEPEPWKPSEPAPISDLISANSVIVSISVNIPSLTLTTLDFSILSVHFYIVYGLLNRSKFYKNLSKACLV